jgi:hypothetical protein
MNAARPWLALVFVAAGCAHGKSVDARVAELSAVTREAREHGAYRCAPEELARAEAELDFARAELGLGDPARAEEHVVRAGANARAALRMSTDPTCRDPVGSTPEAHRAPTFPATLAARLSMTQPPLRRGSTKEHATI